MKYVAYLLAASGLSLAAAPAQASEWWYVNATEEMVDYIDAGSITMQGNVRTAWSHMETAGTDGATAYYKSAKARILFNCAERSIQTLTYLVFNAAGEQVGSLKPDARPLYPPPDTLSADNIDFVCNYTVAGAANGTLGDARRVPAGITLQDFSDRIAKAIVEIKTEDRRR